MADLGHTLTDKELKKLERKVAREYKTAVSEMKAKLTEYFKQDETKRLAQEALLNAGKITEKEYIDWLYRHYMMGENWKGMCDALAEDMMHTDEIALDIIKGKTPDIYALNANWQTYAIEHNAGINTGFTLYNHDTAAYLLGDQRQLMPKPSKKKAAYIKANKLTWNKQKIQSAVLQGVLQGESPYSVAKRLEGVAQMNHNAAVRYARTMGTSAQNAGRYEAIRRAKRVGVNLTIEWQATLDGRTRHDHRLMHGQRREVDEPFVTPEGFSILYPADCTGASDAPQKEIWNCRCTLLSWVKGFEGDTVTDSPKMQGQTFEEWQTEKKKAEPPKVFTQPKKADKIKAEEPKTVKPKDDPYSKDRKAAAKRFPDREEADKYYRPILNENWDDMSEWEKYGVWEYTHNSNPINKSLSGYHEYWDRSYYLGPANTDWGHEDRYRTFEHSAFRNKFGTDGHVNFHRTITELTTGIEKNPLRDDVFVRRGGGYNGLASLAEGAGLDFEETARVLSRGTRAERDAFCNLFKGQVCQEHSFLSTGIANDAGFSGNVQYTIYCPKGTKAIYAEPQSYYGSTIGMNEKIYEKGHSWNGGVGSEAEIIIQRGSYYRITDISVDDWGEFKVEMEVYTQPDYFKFGDEDTFNNGATRHLK